MLYLYRTNKLNNMEQTKIASFRAIEGAIELEFCDEDTGEITATYQAQRSFLVREGFTETEINDYLSQFEWDAAGNCISEY